MRTELKKAAAAHSAWSYLLRGLMIAAVPALFSQTALAIEEKPFVKPVTTEPADGTAADFTADKLVYDPRTELAVATGTVMIVYGPYTLNATRVTFNRKTGVMTANGSVELREPNGNRMLAAEAEMRNKFRDGFARHLTALLTNDATIKSRYAVRRDGYLTVYEQAHYTACKDCKTRSGEPVWELVSDKTTHDEHEHTLYHVNPRLKLGGYTVAGLPYLEQPDPTVKRRTGWLPPHFDSNKIYGFAATVPYFWAFAPNADLTFRPTVTTKQGPLADLEFRHRTQTGLYSIRGMGLYQLDPGSTNSDDRWRGAIETKGAFKANAAWSWGWNAKLVSDRNFLSDYEFSNDDIATNEFYVRGLWDRNYVSAQALNFTALSDDIDASSLPDALPYVSGEHYFTDPIAGGELNLNWSAYSITRDDAGTPFKDVAHGTSQSRAIADLRWQTRLMADNGTLITPFANLRSDIYVTNNLADSAVPGGYRSSETTARIMPSTGVDVRLPLIANYSYGQSIISPVFQFVAATNEKDEDSISNEDAITLNFDHSSLFLEDRFTGLDRYEGGLRTNVGVSYSFLGANGGFIKASAGESFHVAGKNSFASGSGLEGSSSDLIAAITFQPWDALSLSYEGRYEEDLSAINRQEAMASLTFDSFSVNAGYLAIAAEPTYGRPDDEQWAEADVRIGLSEGWYVFGGAKYDLENSLFAEKKIGVEFDCQCMNFKLAYSEQKDSASEPVERRLMMSIDLATLGGTGVSSKF